MINFMNSWIQGIIIAVIIGTIIEMILPEGNNKKYIKVVIGIYILFNIITPVINKVTSGKIDIDSIIDGAKKYETAQSQETISKKLNSNNQSNIKEIYVYNLKNDMKTKIENQGFIVDNLDITVENNDEYTIKKIKLQLQKEKTKVSEILSENSSKADESTSEEDINLEPNTASKEKVNDVTSVDISVNIGNSSSELNGGIKSEKADISNSQTSDNQNKDSNKNSTRNLTVGEKNQIKEYLNTNYQVSKENIEIE